MPVQVTRWAGPEPPGEAALRRILAQEGLHPYPWRNAPGDYYPKHDHSFHKVIYVLEGSITFGLPDEQRRVTLLPGDRLELPPGTLHDAIVGVEGVVCLEAHR